MGRVRVLPFQYGDEVYVGDSPLKSTSPMGSGVFGYVYHLDQAQQGWRYGLISKHKGKWEYSGGHLHHHLRLVKARTLKSIQAMEQYAEESSIAPNICLRCDELRSVIAAKFKV